MKGSDILVSMYWLDKMVHKPKRVNIADFPLLSKSEFLNMEIVASHKSDSVCTFAYYSTKSDVPYVDVYIWDVMLDDGYKRFVITEGYSFGEDDEKIFLDYMLNEIVFEEDEIQNLMKRVKENHENIHLQAYTNPCHIYILHFIETVFMKFCLKLICIVQQLILKRYRIVILSAVRQKRY